jgi:Intracellular proteinase inhibitor
MKTRCLLFAVLILVALLPMARAVDAPATPAPVPTAPKSKKPPATPAPGAPPHPGLFNRIFHTLHLSEDKAADKAKAEESKLPNFKHLVLTMKIEPTPLKLSETHQMKVTLRLENRSKTLVQLDFPTTQRIEVVVKNQEGKLLEHWSEDQAFTNDPGVITVNPGERLEYSASIATRDFKVGTSVSVEGFFPNFEPLHTATTISPEP